MKKVFLALGFIASVLSIKGQDIKGIVYSKEDNAPVEFASVVLLQLPDSALVTGVITYNHGDYTFAGVKPGKYAIKSTFVGYKDGIMSLEISNGKSTFYADTLFLEKASTEIDEVTVTGDMVRGEELVDRTVYSIPPEISKTSVNGYDILRKIPSVQVDFNNNITLNGKSNFIITVDGKQRDKEFLSRLLPEDIKSVEIIHNPSGKYDGSIDGVINIKLNESARVGISGNFAIAGKPGATNMLFGNAGIDYGFKKITFYVSGYGFAQNLQNHISNYYRFKQFPQADSIVDIKGDGDFSISAGSVNTGFDYYVNDKNTLSFNFSYKPNTQETDLLNSGLIYLGTENDYSLNNESNTHNSSDEFNVSLFYKKEFEKPIQELTIESTVYNFESSDKNNYNTETTSLNTNQLFTSLYTNENTVSNRKYFSTKIDYVHPIGVDMRFETGYQVYYQTLNYDFKSNMDGNSNVFDYNELRNAVYAGLIYNRKKFSFQATLRTEYSNIEINDSSHNDYPVILPSTSIQYKINGSQNVKFTYNRRINRPGIYKLNPFEKTDNYFNISSGNPDLEPEYLDKLEIKYTLNFKKNFISPYVYYQHISDKISTLNQIRTTSSQSSQVIYTLPENLLEGYETGFGLNAMLWMFNINGRIFKGHYNEFSNDQYAIDATDYFSYNVRSYVFAPLLKKKLNLFAFIGYQGVRVDAQSKTYSTPFYGAGGQFNYKNHTLGAFYFLPFKNELTMSRTITETDYLYSKVKSSFDIKGFIQVQYSYKFNKGKSVKKVSHKSDVESDTKQGGIGR